MSPLTLAIFLIILVSLRSFVYILRAASLLPKHRKNDWKLPPGPQVLPIIGNLHMLGTLPHPNLYHLAKRYGPIMSLGLGYVPTIVVSSPQAAELFLKTHDTIFASRPNLQASQYMLYGTKGVAFTEYGPYWRNVRKLCTSQLLSASKLELIAPMRRKELGLLVNSLKKTVVTGEVVNLSGKLGELFENMTCEMIFGCSHDDEFDLKILIKEVMSLFGAFNLADYVPNLGALDLQGFTRRMKVVSKSLDKVFEKIIDEHEKDASRQQKQRRDFVDMLLSMLNQPMNANGESLYITDRTNIKAIMLDMVLGSSDTSATTIEWTVSELLRHPRVMIRLQEELENVIGMNRMVEEKGLSKLPYLEMVAKETSRLHPATPFLLPRESIEVITIDGYYIPKKSRIMINFWAIGRDPNVWSDNAEQFLPERFNDNNIDLRGHDFQLIPFVSGRRGCPGMQLGLTNVQLLVAKLVHCFDWKLPNGMLPNELDMSEEFSLVMSRAKVLFVMPSYRLHA